MANSWGTNPIILDTVSTDTSYNSANDVKNGGSQYSTLHYRVKAIQIDGGANGDTIRLTSCQEDDLDGGDIINTTLETGDLNKEYTFGNGVWVRGINPKTLGTSAKVRIYLA